MQFSLVTVLGLAATVGILNALWYELRVLRDQPQDLTQKQPTP